jgi:hypothetical protein
VRVAYQQCLRHAVIDYRQLVVHAAVQFLKVGKKLKYPGHRMAGISGIEDLDVKIGVVINRRDDFVVGGANQMSSISRRTRTPRSAALSKRSNSTDCP